MKSNENNFIRRLQRQKEDALEFIVDKYLPLIKGITYNVLSPLGNDGIMEECINDVILSIWSHSGKFHGDATDFQKWVCAISKYKSIDYYRKARKKEEFASTHLDLNKEKSVEDELIEAENKKEIIELIDQLEPVDRDIFVMKFFLGFKTDEISKRLGLSRAAVDNRIYRGKKKLHTKAANLNLGGSTV
ncbi:MAG TPA: RNA polymerase subunit sigma-70 [Bacillus bacterium]|uniref:sigma-70 family RNA polymerase sigma factor n=1 Tax=Siminovitchia fordii TaxID=254759 RepID=UPI00036D3E6B|nr:sigma-70 family RNA polymerase sigma factor [Siminovitchia fordii]HBZ10790.1 RNA polymerase subunit sigma-70 [Bacillus sp. (in: firmicutes)]